MESETHPPNCYGERTDGLVATTRVRLRARKQTHLHISPSGRRRRRRQNRVCQRVMEEAQEKRGEGRKIRNINRGESFHPPVGGNQINNLLRCAPITRRLLSAERRQGHLSLQQLFSRLPWKSA